MHDPHHLQRFVDAQDGVDCDVIAELRDGRKTTHWMWFVFPQLKGLGRTPTAQQFGIASLDEARAYPAHPVLCPRLRESTRLLLDQPGQPAIESILGSTDALKLRSSTTLFALASETSADREIFTAVLDRYYASGPDERTCPMLSAG